MDHDLSDGLGVPHLLEQVKAGVFRVSAGLTAPSRAFGRAVLSRPGAFEIPYVDPAQAEKSPHSPQHQRLALQAAQEAIVLLKNENHLLPLDEKKIKTLAVIGPNAADVHVGGYGGGRAIP